jgi:hypothetical protein
MTLAWLKWIFLGGVIFWGLDVLLDLLFRFASTRVVIGLKTVTPPLVLVSAYLVLVKHRTDRLVSGLLMLLGIWVGGPIYMVLKLPFQATENIEMIPTKAWVWTFLIFPLSTFSYSTYSGALGGLIISTVALFLVTALVRRRRSSPNHASARSL